MVAKRKNEEPHTANGSSKKRALSDEEAHDCFGPEIFARKEEFTQQYAKSTPYKHGVIQNPISDSLLRNVRAEIKEHLHFTPKETDIYKIQQSGDLANLDGLDDSSLARLPSLLKLRDALYSPAFRAYIAHVAGAGPVSGRKTDMAINVYTPTSHLLCHDDVIGTRRISYILYLTDPDVPWQAGWGGALRLYPTQKMKSKDGQSEVVVPGTEWALSIPPAWNQLSFFAIQPGESFHDVEEVYVRKDGQTEADGGRVRMAISGWYHIPQEGEEGYEEGLEEKLAERSSLNQLQSKADEFDLPQAQWREVDETPDIDDEDDAPFSDDEMEFLLRFINPNYLTPDTVEAISSSFEENSVATLQDFLAPRFAQKLKDYIAFQDSDTSTAGSIPFLSPSQNKVHTARPPHKHRYIYRQPAALGLKESAMDTPLDQLLEHFLPSPLFVRWLALVTGLSFARAAHMARRFRRGLDYTLATSYEDEEPQLEVCLGITPSKGWGGDDDEDEAATTNGEDEEPVGGYEMYMAADDDDDDDNDGEGSDHGVSIPQPSSATGAGQRRRAKSKADPAIYKSSAGNDEEDDGVLFTNPASWNVLSLVLRDRGVLKFVKYVSQSAKGDRWDVVGEYTVAEDEDEEGE